MRASLAPDPSSQHPFAGLPRRRFSVPAVLTLLTASLIAACIEPELALERAGEERSVTIPVGEGDNLTLPVTFAGDLPCKDCVARRVTLTLRPDTVFLTRTVWVGDPEPNESYDLGRWVLDTRGGKLILKGGADGDVQLAMVDADAIRVLSIGGTDSAAADEATLMRARRVDRFDEPLRLRGFFIHTRGGPMLAECASGKRWPIAAERNYFVLDRAYRATRPSAGVPMLVSVDARLVLRRRAAGQREMVVIEGVNRLWREGNCQNDPTSPDPLQRPWQLVDAAAARQ